MSMFYVSAESIGQAVRQIERWMFAVTQDRNPGVALLHANYAVGDLDMLRQMTSNGAVMRVTGKSMLEMLKRATKLQDMAQRRLGKFCKIK